MLWLTVYNPSPMNFKQWIIWRTEVWTLAKVVCFVLDVVCSSDSLDVVISISWVNSQIICHCKMIIICSTLFGRYKMLTKWVSISTLCTERNSLSLRSPTVQLVIYLGLVNSSEKDRDLFSVPGHTLWILCRYLRASEYQVSH